MSKDLYDDHGLIVTRFCGQSKKRMYQINHNGKYIAMDIVEIIRLRNILTAMCFDNPPCNKSEFHSKPIEVYS